MDATSIIIIVVSTLLAIIFKVVLYKRIQKWMDQDLLKGLANGDDAKHAYLKEQHQLLLAQKVKRKHLHQQLIDLAEQFEQNP